MSTSWYMRIDLPFDGTPAEAEAALEEALRYVAWNPHRDGHHISISDDIPVQTTGDEIAKPAHESDVSYEHGRIRAELWMENIGRAVETIYVDGVEVPDPRARIAVMFDNLSLITTAQPGDILGGLDSEHGEGDRGPIVMTSKGLRFAYSDGNAHIANQGWFGHANVAFPPISRVPVELIDDEEDEWRRCGIDVEGLRLMLGGRTVEYMRHLSAKKTSR